MLLQDYQGDGTVLTPHNNKQRWDLLLLASARTTAGRFSRCPAGQVTSGRAAAASSVLLTLCMRWNAVIAVQEQPVAAGVAGAQVDRLVAGPHVGHLALMRLLWALIAKVTSVVTTQQDIDLRRSPCPCPRKLHIIADHI